MYSFKKSSFALFFLKPFIERTIFTVRKGSQRKMSGKKRDLRGKANNRSAIEKLKNRVNYTVAVSTKLDCELMALL